MSKGWDNAALKKLKLTTGKGLSTAEIGKRLGMSKNAIVGKLNRLGWNLKANDAEMKSPAFAKAKIAVPKKVGTAPKKSVVVSKKSPAPAKAFACAKTASGKPEKSKPAVNSAKVAAVRPAPKKTPVQKEASSKSSTKNLAMHQRIIQHSLSMASLKTGQCRWPIGDPDSEHFHFCGESVFVGKPYCYEHCRQAYQFNPPKKK